MDTTSNQVSTNYDQDWVKNAPIPRYTFFDLINAAPGVAQTLVRQRPAPDLLRLVARTRTRTRWTGPTSPLPSAGAAWPYPNTDAIEEIEVLSLGAPAEYGNLQGAVFNVVTRRAATRSTATSTSTTRTTA